MAEAHKPIAVGLLGEGKVAVPSDQSSTSLGVNIGDMPLDEPILFLFSNEAATALRVGFPATANSPRLAGNSERQIIVTAGLATQASARSTIGSGVAVGWAAWRMAR